MNLNKEDLRGIFIINASLSLCFDDWKQEFSRSKATRGLFPELSDLAIYLASEEVSSETLASPVRENVVIINTHMSKINHRYI